MRQTALLNLVVLSCFVLLFRSIHRRRPSNRLKFWIAAWACAVVHFAVLLWEPSSANWSSFVDALSVSALMLCGYCFILSSKRLADRPRLFRLLGAGLALPSLAFATCTAYNVRATAVFVVLDILAHGLGVIALWRLNREKPAVTVPGTAVIFICSQWVSYELIKGQSGSALSVVLMELFALYALFFGLEFWRRTTGVLTTLIGLLSWAAVFPVGMLLASRWPTFLVDPEVWNVPKVVVAFGMIVTLFEDELVLAAREREQYQRLFDGHPLPMWIFDMETTQLLEANAAAIRDFGWKRADLTSLHANDLLSRREASPLSLLELNWRLAEDTGADGAKAGGTRARPNEVHARSVHFQTHHGEEVLVDVTLQRVDFIGREARLMLAKDVTAQVEAQEQLIHQANHDPLTGLPNRLLLQDRMQGAIATATRHGTRAAVICMDLDRFKHINDTYGHAAGDTCLREVADRLRRRLRSVDTAARVGGEEFVVILDDLSNLGDAERVVDDLLFGLSIPVMHEEEEIRLSASIGIAVFPDDGQEPAKLWSKADAAMYRAKHSGGNRHRFYSQVV